MTSSLRRVRTTTATAHAHLLPLRKWTLAPMMNYIALVLTCHRWKACNWPGNKPRMFHWATVCIKIVKGRHHVANIKFSYMLLWHLCIIIIYTHCMQDGRKLENIALLRHLLSTSRPKFKQWWNFVWISYQYIANLSHSWSKPWTKSINAWATIQSSPSTWRNRHCLETCSITVCHNNIIVC